MSISPPPRVLAILRQSDSGEFGATQCPHCGAAGRYITTYLTETGKEYSCMSGCLDRAGYSRSQLAKLTKEALSRQREAKSNNKPLARWWQDILDGVAALQAGRIDVETLRAGVAEIETVRQDWLRRNGYKRK